MMTVCGVCGKRIVVTWPEFWVYKTGKGEDTVYYCSENCLVVADTKEMKERCGWKDEPWITEEELNEIQAGRTPFRRLKRTTRPAGVARDPSTSVGMTASGGAGGIQTPSAGDEIPPRASLGRDDSKTQRTGKGQEEKKVGNNKGSHKLTREEKENAVMLAIAGKDPIGYLKECGAKNPWASWAYIKNVLKKKKPEIYKQIPNYDDRLEEEISYGAAAEKEAADDQEGLDIQTAEGVGEPEAPADGTPAAERPAGVARDPSTALGMTANGTAGEELDGFRPYTPKRSRGRLVMDEHGLHTVEDPEQPKPEKNWLAEIAEKVPDVDAGDRPSAVARDPSTSVGMTADDAAAGNEIPPRATPGRDDRAEAAEGVLKERSELIHDAHGIRMKTERLLDDLPCKITGMKINEFEFNLNRSGVVLILPESDRTFIQAMITLTPEQWKRLITIVPKVMNIFGV